MMITSTPMIVPISPLFTVPSLPHVLTSGSVSPRRGQIAPESYLSLQRKAGGGKNSLVTLAAAIAMGMPLIPRAGAGQVRRALPGSPPQADAVDAPAARQ